MRQACFQIFIFWLFPVQPTSSFDTEKYISKEFAESFQKYLLKYENKI
jgi:hypothetical protein